MENRQASMNAYRSPRLDDEGDGSFASFINADGNASAVDMNEEEQPEKQESSSLYDTPKSRPSASSSSSSFLPSSFALFPIHNIAYTILFSFVLCAVAASGFFYSDYRSAQQLSNSAFEACGMCSSSPSICSTYGREALDLTRAFTGTGTRLQALLQKAERGEKITIGILGGSVSEGFGVPENSRWHEIVADWFINKFPETEIELVNGAVPGRGTEYFMSCHGEHIPQESDLVIVEVGVNDWHNGHPYDNDAETLVRAVLNYPSRPAVIFAETFSLTLPQLSAGADAHLSVAQYYDIPVISLRNWLLPALQRDSSLKDSYLLGDRDGTGKHNDYLHIGPRVHRAFGEHINALLAQQLCRSRNVVSAPPAHTELDEDWIWPSTSFSAIDVPRLRLSDNWSDSFTNPITHSKCLSLNSPHPESQLSFNSTASSGFDQWNDEVPWRNVKTYLRGEGVGSRIVFSNVELTAGTWTLYYLRSNKKRLGNTKCWVDDDVAGSIYVEGWWERKMDVGEVLPMHSGLSVGAHDITCEIYERTNDPEGGHMFLVIAHSLDVCIVDSTSSSFDANQPERMDDSLSTEEQEQLELALALSLAQTSGGSFDATTGANSKDATEVNAPIVISDSSDEAEAEDGADGSETELSDAEEVARRAAKRKKEKQLKRKRGTHEDDDRSNGNKTSSKRSKIDDVVTSKLDSGVLGSQASRTSKLEQPTPATTGTMSRAEMEKARLARMAANLQL